MRISWTKSVRAFLILTIPTSYSHVSDLENGLDKNIRRKEKNFPKVHAYTSELVHISHLHSPFIWWARHCDHFFLFLLLFSSNSFFLILFILPRVHLSSFFFSPLFFAHFWNLLSNASSDFKTLVFLSS